jgi:hypothetical protein
MEVKSEKKEDISDTGCIITAYVIVDTTCGISL